MSWDLRLEFLMLQTNKNEFPFRLHYTQLKLYPVLDHQFHELAEKQIWDLLRPHSDSQESKRKPQLVFYCDELLNGAELICKNKADNSNRNNVHKSVCCIWAAGAVNVAHVRLC